MFIKEKNRFLHETKELRKNRETSPERVVVCTRDD